MTPNSTEDTPGEPSAPVHASRWRVIALWFGISAVVLTVAIFVAGLVLWHNVQPLLRDRVVDSLASHFHAHVELDEFHASASNDFSVTGAGLRIVPFGLEQYPPVISVDSFQFQMRLAELFDPRRHVRLVRVNGLHITLPPKVDRKGLSFGGFEQDKQSKPHTLNQPKLFVDAVIAKDATLTLLTDKPGKPPMVVDIHSLHLTSKWDTGAMHYKATLRNPKPVGEIESEGDFGPWNDDQPRETPLSGDYTFHADLASIKGIAGLMDSTGHFSGPLDHLTVDGRSDVPDFLIEEAQHPVALSATFHAIVDGTSGDTYLRPVEAHYRNTWFTCTGQVVRVKLGDQSLGHHITLQVSLRKGRIEDILWLAVKASPPVITGNLQLHNSLDLPPDPTHTLTVAHRIGLKGTVTITQMHFTDPETDKKMDSISLRTQGKVDEANQLRHSTGPDDVALDGTLHGNFTLSHDVLNLEPATFTLPGVDATVAGTYALDGQQFNFQGNAKLQATVSQMFTGWKSMLLKPVDPLFKRHGAGTYIPFHIGGTKDSPRFGIDFGKLK